MLQGDDGLITDPKAVTNTFGQILSETCRGSQCLAFLAVKHRVEARPIIFPEDDSSSYNAPFTCAEMDDALEHCSNNAAGEDDMHYSVLKRLPEVTLQFLLSLFNNIFFYLTLPC